MDKKNETETTETNDLLTPQTKIEASSDDESNEGVEIELTRNGKPKRPRNPKFQDVRLPVEIDIANDAKKMGKMIRRGRVSLFLEYIREGLKRDIIKEQAILNAKGFVPTCALLVNTLASANTSATQETKSTSDQETNEDIAA
jgi:hypothetical protein